jgi:hypothetical protein
MWRGMKVQFVTPYRVSRWQRYGVTVRGNVTSVYPPLGIQHAMRMRHIVIYGLPGSTIFFHIISKTVRFSKKKLNLKLAF